MGDTLFTGGTVITIDENQPRAEAALVRGASIVAVGSASRVQAEARNPEIIDLRGRTLAPGFNDAHLHVTQLGDRSKYRPLAGLSKAEILEVLVETEKDLKPGDVLLGYDWDYPSCPDPHRKDLDALFPDRPVLLFQFSGHAAWANSKGLELLRLSRSTEDWEMGGVDRDPDGELNGIIREPGQAPGVRRLFIKHMGNRREAKEQLRAAMVRLREHGITSVQDNTWFPWVVSALRDLHDAGELTVRFSCWSPGFLKPLDLWFGLKSFKPDWYSRGPRKHFLDGAFSSHTAWLTQPYADKPETSGAGLAPEKIIPLVRRATRQGRQIACHSIGNASTKAYAEAVQAVCDERPHNRCARELRHRIEHGQLIDSVDIEHIASLGMVVSAQPHAAATPEKDITLLGPERAARAYPFRSLLDAGVPLAFGSDYPGEATFDPIYGVHLAVNREGPEAIGPEEALACYTAGSAWAEFREDSKGRIKKGYAADLVILSADPTRIKRESIKDIRVDLTMVDGRTVYTRGPSDGTDIDLARQTVNRRHTTGASSH